MNPLRRLLPIAFLLLAAPSHASPAGAQRIQKSFGLAMEKWALETRTATTPEARAKAWAKRPDPADFARQMWQEISSSLDQEWTLEPAAWFLRIAPGLKSQKLDGSSTPDFTNEVETIRKAIETQHLDSTKLVPVCTALAAMHDPRSLAVLEKLQANHPDPKIQGVAAISAAINLKSFGDESEIMRKRLTYLRKAIIQSSDVDLGGGLTVAKLAEDELYIIRFLSKGRIAPDLTGLDSAGNAMKLSTYAGKVVILTFWSSTDPEAERAMQMTSELAQKFEGRPVVVIGVNHDPLDKLRSLQADQTVTWPNFTDSEKKLATEYRVASWPAVFVLDGERKIHYVGTPGSFAELTADALASEIQTSAE
jgi:peroxiredoxin